MGSLLWSGVTSYTKEKSKLTQNLRKAIVNWESNKNKISKVSAYYKYLRYDVFIFPISKNEIKEIKVFHSYDRLKYTEINNQSYNLFDKNTQQKYYKFLESKFKVYNFERIDLFLLFLRSLQKKKNKTKRPTNYFKLF